MKITKALYDEIKERAKTEYIVKLAKEFGFNEGYLCQILKNGFDFNKVKSRSHIDEEVVISILKDRMAGIKPKQLFLKYNIKKSDIKNILAGKKYLSIAKKIGYVKQQKNKTSKEKKKILTKEEIVSILKDKKEGKLSNNEISEKYKITLASFYNVIGCKYYKDIKKEIGYVAPPAEKRQKYFFTETQINEIRNKADFTSYADLAKEYNCSLSAISQIKIRHIYANVPFVKLNFEKKIDEEKIKLIQKKEEENKNQFEKLGWFERVAIAEQVFKCSSKMRTKYSKEFKKIIERECNTRQDIKRLQNILFYSYCFFVDKNVDKTSGLNLYQ